MASPMQTHRVVVWTEAECLVTLAHALRARGQRVAVLRPSTVKKGGLTSATRQLFASLDVQVGLAGLPD